MRFLLIAVAVSFVLPQIVHAQPGPPTAANRSTGRHAVAENCFLAVLDRVGEAQVPAQESGVLMLIQVREGQSVQQGTLLAQIDDKQAQTHLRGVAAEESAAREKAQNDIDIRHAHAAAEVAKYDYLTSEEANKQVPGTVIGVEIKRKKFEWDRANLAIEQARKEQVVAGYTADAKKAELENAQEAVVRRRIASPIDGIVEKSFVHLGEWVKAGDPVFRIVRLDRLQVDAHLSAHEFNPSEVIDQPVVVTVELARGRKVQVPGRVVFVQSEVHGGNIYAVRAEVENAKENGQWLLRPGMEATVAIELR